MSSVTPRKRNGIWYADINYQCPITGTRKRKQLSAGKDADRKSALKKGWKWLSLLEETGSLIEKKKPVVTEVRYAFSGVAARYLDEYVSVYLKPSAYRNAESVLRVHWVPFFKGKDIGQITFDHISRYLALMSRNGLKKKSQNNYMAILSGLFRQAVKWGYIKQSPMIDFKWHKIDKLEYNFYDEEQTQHFLSTAEQFRPDLYAFYFTAFTTGMRLGELCGLQWGDIDFVKNKIHVRHNYVRGVLGSPKSGESRFIKLHTELAQVFKSHRHLRGDFVFCHEDGTPLEVNDTRKPFFWLQKKAGLHRIKFHEIRHSFASQLVMNGKPMKAIAQFMGHSTVWVTEIYGHLTPEAEDEAINSLKPTKPRSIILRKAKGQD